ncbi:MAG: YchJ family protein, partial [Bdellovibrionales bacterium]|nr:YchJ family protein [Bdellovibrionales bacterium]
SMPETAEKLMRSRYTAYAMNNVDYIEKTLAPESRSDFDRKSTEEWAVKATWKGLKVISTKRGLETDKKGTVEFTATYEQDGEVIEHHEVSEFRKNDKGQWFFVDGDSHTHRGGEGHHHHHHAAQTVVREEPKVGRNDPCVCGSGKKYKKCCG